MNIVCISGRLTADPEIVEYGKGKDKGKMARITVAVRDGLDEEGEPRAQFLRCIVFGKGAEVFEEFGYKGMAVSVSGRLKNGMYEDKDGITRYTTDIYVSDFDLLGSKKSSEEDEDDKKPAKKTNSYKKHR